MTWQIRVAALTAIVLAGCTALVDNNSQTKIQANGETLIGNTEDGIAVFRGIPFAQPPVDDLRWRAPRPAIPRSGEQQATKFAAACIQDEYQVDWYRDLIREFAGDPKKAPQPLAISEDCLYLNIWTPALNATANLPVMVYIYGGNNLAGWSYEPNYRGHGLAARDVVVISVGYRQGVFGTFNHPEIAAQIGADGSGNFNLLDLIAALRWLKENIQVFGGDPANVTLFGESAGAANIGYLSVSPLARGLYHRAIKQSGGFEINHDYINSYDEEKQLGLDFSAIFNQSSLAKLRALPAETVHRSAMTHYKDNPVHANRKSFFAILDGYVLPDTPANLMARGQINPGDYLLGSNGNESLWYTSKATSIGDVNHYLRTRFPSASHDQLRDLLSHSVDHRHQLALLYDSIDYHCPILKQATAIHRQMPDSIYVYRFTKARDHFSGGQLGAYHGAELPYVFGTHDDWLPTSPSDITLSEMMMQYWVNFARNGDPNGYNLPIWRSFSHQSSPVVELGDHVGMIEPAEKPICELLEANNL
ncbi:carboxylesterase family protein [Porticoccaceae bacterium]|nr:carboxylesterase family protein [Porticoccaceae bacterium]